MRVKRLEIQGFKSFKDKTVIHFDHNITGIVGPNGCGKSNIVDAFFWVMGEQSYKHMRGNSSEDLIFNGSSKYSSMGVAEATLVMETHSIDTAHAPAGASVEDLPYHLRAKEVSVTRRLYRSGEGEYFINGVLARLKDIQELFMDTGVGAKGYSVIEQGQIGKIVNAKPEERRLLVEEAAGIAKYKARKKESLRKMEATHANLSRLTDIIQEIERNLGSLEKQAQKAKLYRKYKEELFDQEITWGNRKRRVIEEKMTELKNRKEVLEQDLVGMRAAIQADENQAEIDRISLVSVTKDAELCQAKIQDLSHELSSQKSSLELSKRRQGDLASQLQGLADEQTQLETSIQQDSDRLQSMEQQILQSNQSLQDATANLSTLNDSVSAMRKEAGAVRTQVDQFRKSLLQTMNQCSALTSRSAGLLSKSELARNQADKLALQEDGQKQKLASIQTELDKTRTAMSDLGEEKDLLAERHSSQMAQVEQAQESMIELEREKNRNLRVMTDFRSKLETLQELDQSHEGLADGPRAALDWAKTDAKGKQIQVLTDYLDVSSGYESVLEAWLGVQLEYLATTESECIHPVLEYLRIGKKGRVGIQLLTAQQKDPVKKKISDSSLDTVRPILENEGFKILGCLSDFVRLDPKIAFLHPLIDTVCIVESFSALPSFLKSNGLSRLEGWSLVSLDGMTCEASGVVRGGSFGQAGTAGILKRKKQIEILQAQVVEAENQHASSEEASNECKALIEQLTTQLKSIQSERQNLEIRSATLERDLHQITRAQKEAQLNLTAIQQDAALMLKDAQQAISERESLEKQLEELTQSQSKTQIALSAAEQALSEQESASRIKEADLQSIRVLEASLRERLVSLKGEKEAIRSVLADRQHRNSEIHRILQRATQEQAQFMGSESELTEKIQDLTLTLGHQREAYAGVKDRIEQLNATIRETLERIKERHKAGETKSTESTKLALDFEKLGGELSHLTLNLEEKYGPGCLGEKTSENTESTVEMSAEEEVLLNEEVERLRERIRRLGEVNVMAIEEFETLKKRFDHLLGEKADLEKSLDNLKEAIDHINKTSEERFKKAFEAIAERFEKLFPVIFGGGQAKLSLVYPEGSSDILEAGVDILAQPPGKKVTNIGLLSGGEKALTAVSLIFAIFMVKPSPFCVLDEVDAPLDDANIGRFNALLREMSSKSQFILITHNKKTMELNDTLYGVTMEEPGVSKMVSVQMQ